MSIPEQLARLFETKPLVLLQFGELYRAAYKERSRELNRLTIAQRHDVFTNIRPPMLCLVQEPDGPANSVSVGVILRRAAVTGFDTRLTVAHLNKLNLFSIATLKDRVGTKLFQTLLGDRLANEPFSAVLSTKLSVEIIELLSQDPINKSAIAATAAEIPGFTRRSAREWEQFDAIKTSLTAFGLKSSAVPSLVAVPAESDSTLKRFDGAGTIQEVSRDNIHVLEDSVIDRDASVIPGFALVKKHLTGRAVFENGRERLEVFTANKKPLEEMLGVDLIYVNSLIGNTVMVQYKMLSAAKSSSTEKTEWIYRPDEQFDIEVQRMQLPRLDGEREGYRLHGNPFFFKFVKRKGDGESHKSFIVSLEHLRILLGSPKCKGPKGGLRIGFDSLDGVYLRETEFLGLIKCGYIGLHRDETTALAPIINEVADGNRALVLAWQQRIEGAAP